MELVLVISNTQDMKIFLGKKPGRKKKKKTKTYKKDVSKRDEG